MPSKTIPLVGPYTRRPYTDSNSAKDQQFINVLFEQVSDDVLNQSNVYAFKRPGIPNAGIFSAGRALFYSLSLGSSARPYLFGGASSGAVTIYVTTSLGAGTASGSILHMSEIICSGVTFVMITASDATGWFIASDAFSVNGSGVPSIPTFTGDRTSGSPVVINVSSIAGLYPGQLITATGFSGTTRILSIDSATQVTMTNNASSGAPTNTTFTREALAKIIDTDFPTNITGQFTDIDGFSLIMTENGRIYNSKLNIPYSWDADNYLTCNTISDGGVGLGKTKDLIAGIGTKSIEHFRNAGNPSASPLSRIASIAGYGATKGSRGKALICSADDKIYWAGYAGNCYMFNGNAPTLIAGQPASGTVVSAVSNTFESVDVATISGNRYIHFMVLTANAGAGRLYDIEKNRWSTSGYNSTYMTDTLQGDTAQQRTYLTNSTNVYAMDSSSSAVFQDAGASYTMTVQTDPYALNGGKPFTINSVDLLADNQSSGSSTLKIFQDDYTTAETIGTYDLTKTTKRISRPKYIKSGQVAFQITDSGNNAWRGQALIVNWEPAVA